MSDLSAVKALVFDVFGTVVDWRSSLIADFTKWGEASGVKADWTALVDGWRAVYAASMDDVRKHPERGYVMLDRCTGSRWKSCGAAFDFRACPTPICII